ncbi:hypothetical protein Tco_0851916 [Tanacetum coccineum]
MEGPSFGAIKIGASVSISSFQWFGKLELEMQSSEQDEWSISSQGVGKSLWNDGQALFDLKLALLPVRLKLCLHTFESLWSKRERPLGLLTYIVENVTGSLHKRKAMRVGVVGSLFKMLLEAGCPSSDNSRMDFMLGQYGIILLDQGKVGLFEEAGNHYPQKELG